MSISRKPTTVVKMLALLVLAAGVTCGGSWAGQSADGYTLVIGKVSANPKKHYRYLAPIVEYVAAQMRDVGVTGYEVVLARDEHQMVQYLRQGRVDWVTETPFSAVLFIDAAGAKVLARRWRKGVPEYHTVFFARKDAGIATLDDLKGKTVAFEDPGSTSAYYVPASVLIREGLTLVPLQSPRDLPPPDKVGYVFSGQEINTSTWVHKSLVSAGAFSNLDWDKDDHLPTAFKDDLAIFHRTQPFPRSLELVRGDLDPAITDRLKTIMLTLHRDPAAKAALHRYQRTQQFDDIDERVLAGIEEARRLRSIVETNLR